MQLEQAKQMVIADYKQKDEALQRQIYSVRVQIEALKKQESQLNSDLVRIWQALDGFGVDKWSIYSQPTTNSN